MVILFYVCLSHFCECDICQISNTLRDLLVVQLNSRMNLSEFVVVSCEGHGDLTKHIFDLLCNSTTGELLFVSSQHVKIPRDNPDRGHVFKSVDLVYFCILFHTELRFVFDDLVHATKSRSNMGKSISLIAKQ